MNPKVYLLALILGFEAACEQVHKNEPVQESMIQDKINSQPPKTFLDSVARQYALTIPQITSHTQIPGIFYNGVNSGAGFYGDKVIDLAYGYKGGN